MRNAPLFAALGDPTRVQLVARLCALGPSSIATLVAGSDVTRQAITKHLHVLDEAGLVAGSRRGREQVWELKKGPLGEARSWLQRLENSWDERLSRLRALVEDDADGEP